jgi:hypothetical protein
MPNDSAAHDVSVRIEQEGANSFRIQSGQLEQIGAQLRGRREFSIFQSIILPLIVSVATIILSSAFQYVSWFNSVGVKDATDVADKAARTYETSAAAIGTRHYATVVFLPSLKHLVQAKGDAESTRARAASLLKARAEVVVTPGAGGQGKGTKDKDLAAALASAKRSPEADRALLSAVTQGAEDKKDNEISLHKFAMDTKQKRFASYYEQLKLWNENYDHLLSEIEYALDRPVFGQADKRNENFRISRGRIREIDCLNYSFSEELEKQHLNAHSLKLRFAVIHNCFMVINDGLYKQLNEAISKTVPSFDEPTETQISEKLGALLAMANEFRCYAHQRIDFYNAQKELAIFSPSYLWRWLTDASKTAAQKHFDDAAGKCNPPKRAA